MEKEKTSSSEIFPIVYSLMSVRIILSTPTATSLKFKL